MKYLVLAAPYYKWAAKNLNKLHQDNSVYADARWMAELFEIVSEQKGVARIRSKSGIERSVPVSALVEFPV